ncbi:hypothetical protein IAT38_001417 [Cryptococcus sp. DSM 104549]
MVNDAAEAKRAEGETPTEAGSIENQKVAIPTDEAGQAPLDGQSLVATGEGSRRLPWGAKWRSSAWYITLVVALGVTTDILTYTIVVPVLPYRLQSLGYNNVSALTAWLLFAYSLGIFIFTFPVAYFFHKYPYRRNPLIIAVLVLEGALVLFMLARPYWAMLVSRFLQGAASTVVWSVGFALICENVEEKNIGRQIGFAMAGISVGSTIAPPIGGALYSKMGWHSPFVFCIIVCAVDLFLRLFVLERSDLRKWEEKHGAIVPAAERGDLVENGGHGAVGSHLNHLTKAEKDKLSGKELSPWMVMVTLASSPRGMTSFCMMLAFGMIIGALEPTLTLRVQSIWNKDSDYVGLIYLAAAAPTFFCGPIIGALADKYGAEWIMFPSIILTLPWLPLLLLKKSLAGFIIIFALANLFPNCAMSPTGLEVTMVARNKEGISEIHQFAAMNVAFAVSTAIGTVAGGQMYDHVPQGWVAVCWFCFGIAVAVTPLTFFFAGNRSLWRRLSGKGKAEEVEMEEARGAGEEVEQSEGTEGAGVGERGEEAGEVPASEEVKEATRV